MRQQVQGLHGFFATAAKQPVFVLSDMEAALLTNALADVLDYHKLSLDSIAGPYGLYLTLIATGFMIYKPRIAAIRLSRIELPVADQTPAFNGVSPVAGANGHDALFPKGI